MLLILFGYATIAFLFAVLGLALGAADEANPMEWLGLIIIALLWPAIVLLD